MSELTTIERVLSQRSEATFQASNDQKRAKSQFWTTFSSGSVVPPSQPDLTIAAQYAGDSRIRSWWATPGFESWFWNQNEYEERLDYLAQIALDKLEGMIESARTSDSARISAIKLVLEMGKRIGKSDDDAKFADSKIAAMDRQQLEAFISSRTKLLSNESK